MTKLQALARELRERLNTQNRKLLLLAVPELAGAIACLDLFLEEISDLDDRIAILEARVTMLDGEPFQHKQQVQPRLGARNGGA